MFGLAWNFFIQSWCTFCWNIPLVYLSSSQVMNLVSSLKKIMLPPCYPARRSKKSYCLILPGIQRRMKHDVFLPPHPLKNTNDSRFKKTFRERVNSPEPENDYSDFSTAIIWKHCEPPFNHRKIHEVQHLQARIHFLGQLHSYDPF